MTAHPLSLVRTISRSGPPKAGRHTLSELDIGRFGKRTTVFMPTGSAIDEILALAGRKLRGLAAGSIVHKVASHNPDTLWAIAHKDAYDTVAPNGEGFVAFLMLNENGLQQLLDGTLNRADPDLALLAAQNERPAAIYTWALFAPDGLVGAIPLIYDKLCTPLYAGVSMFAWAATPIAVPIM